MFRNLCLEGYDTDFTKLWFRCICAELRISKRWDEQLVFCVSLYFGFECLAYFWKLHFCFEAWVVPEGRPRHNNRGEILFLNVFRFNAYIQTPRQFIIRDEMKHFVFFGVSRLMFCTQCVILETFVLHFSREVAKFSDFSKKAIRNVLYYFLNCLGFLFLSALSYLKREIPYSPWYLHCFMKKCKPQYHLIRIFT